MTDKTRLKNLLELYKSGKIEWNDHQELFHLIADEANENQVKEYMLGNEDLAIHPAASQSDWETIFKQISEKTISENSSLDKPAMASVHRIHFLKTRWLRYVAMIFLVLGTALYFLISNVRKETYVETMIPGTQPGSDKAVLTLSDGRKIILSDSLFENVSDAQAFINNENGVLTYNPVSTSEILTVGYNVMATPRGGQYRVILPDGSKVWMNSASTLKYPTVFTGKNRQVELSGEAYFEIKENKLMPFAVKTNNVQVVVLGTEFNVNSYENEPEILTTLINGSVKVTSGGDSKIIKPGQQIQILRSNLGHLRINDEVDVTQIIAWQKGIFEFNSTGLQTIARQLSRWYDVDVVADSGNGNFTFSGGINKKTPLDKVLRIFEANGIKHKWEKSILRLYTE